MSVEIILQSIPSSSNSHHHMVAQNLCGRRKNVSIIQILLDIKWEKSCVSEIVHKLRKTTNSLWQIWGSWNLQLGTFLLIYVWRETDLDKCIYWPFLAPEMQLQNMRKSDKWSAVNCTHPKQFWESKIMFTFLSQLRWYFPAKEINAQCESTAWVDQMVLCEP